MFEIHAFVRVRIDVQRVTFLIRRRQRKKWNLHVGTGESSDERDLVLGHRLRAKMPQMYCAVLGDGNHFGLRVALIGRIVRRLEEQQHKCLSTDGKRRRLTVADCRMSSLMRS